MENAPLLLPTELSPAKLGFHWGMAFDAAQYAEVGNNTVYDFAIVAHDFDGVPYRLALSFDEQGLGCISCITHVSRDFWDDRDDMEEIGDEYDAICKHLVATAVDVLGPPDLALPEHLSGESSKEIQDSDVRELFFDAPQNSPIYEKWHSGTDGPEAIWMRQEARFQIGLMKGDTELPYMITISAMRGDGRT